MRMSETCPLQLIEMTLTAIMKFEQGKSQWSRCVLFTRDICSKTNGHIQISYVERCSEDCAEFQFNANEFTTAVTQQQHVTVNPMKAK